MVFFGRIMSANSSGASTLSTSGSGIAKVSMTDARTVFLAYIQPLLNLSALIENAIIFIVFLFFVTPRGRGLSHQTGGSGRIGGKLGTVSRLYYTLIAFCEFISCLFGFFLRNTLYYVPIWVLFHLLQYYTYSFYSCILFLFSYWELS